jgi:hypothetical protein
MALAVDNWNFTASSSIPPYFFNLPNTISAYAEYGVRAQIESTPNSIGFLSSTCK